MVKNNRAHVIQVAEANSNPRNEDEIHEEVKANQVIKVRSNSSNEGKRQDKIPQVVQVAELNGNPSNVEERHEVPQVTQAFKGRNLVYMYILVELDGGYPNSRTQVLVVFPKPEPKKKSDLQRLSKPEFEKKKTRNLKHDQIQF